MENFEREMLMLQIRNLEEQVRVLRKELTQKVNNLEEAINKILQNEGMVVYGE